MGDVSSLNKHCYLYTFFLLPLMVINTTDALWGFKLLNKLGCHQKLISIGSEGQNPFNTEAKALYLNSSDVDPTHASTAGQWGRWIPPECSAGQRSSSGGLGRSSAWPQGCGGCLYGASSGLFPPTHHTSASQRAITEGYNGKLVNLTKTRHISNKINRQK